MRQNRLIVASLCLTGLLTVAACGKTDATDGAAPTKSGGADSKSAGDTKAKPAAAKPTKIDKLGLTCDLPADTVVSDGVSDNSVMISSTDSTFTVAPAKATDPKTADDAKAGALATENLKIEKLSDGWIVTSENTGSMGRNYWLTMRREIGGKGYMCETMQPSQQHIQAAITACKSLKQ